MKEHQETHSRPQNQRYADIITELEQFRLTNQRRLASIHEDCSAALDLNPDLGKAYRVRGIAQRKLGKYKEAKSDLAQAGFKK